MKKYFALLLSVICVFAASTGCNKQSKPSVSNKPNTEIIVNNWEKDALADTGSEKRLSIDEFINIIDGKTELNQADMPHDKACYITDRLNMEGYIIGESFTLSCIYADDPKNNLYSLKHFTNGTADGEVTNLTEFTKFINSYADGK